MSLLYAQFSLRAVLGFYLSVTYLFLNRKDIGWKEGRAPHSTRVNEQRSQKAFGA